MTILTLRVPGPRGRTGIPGSASLGTKLISATTYTLLDEDHGYIGLFSAGTDITATVVAGLPDDFYFGIVPTGLGAVTVVPGSGVSIVEADNNFTTETRYVMLTLVARATDSYLLVGRTI